LNQEQKDSLSKAKELFDQEKYSEAMEALYQIQPEN